MTTGHLDEEALSAAVDGTATAPEQAHLSSCSRCQVQLASLAAVARAVGAPVTPRPAADVDAAVERALAGWAPVPAATWDRPDDVVPPVVGIRAEPTGDRSVPWASRGPTRPGGRSRRWLVAGAGIAAAVVVAAGVVTLAQSSARSGSFRASTAAATTIAPRLPALSGGPAGTVSGGNLGDQSDPSAVAHLAVSALSGGGGGGTTGSHASASGSAAGPAGPGGQQQGTASSPATPSAVAPGGPACVAQAQAAAGVPAGSGAVVRFTATLEWQGRTAAVVVVFSQPQPDRPPLAGAIMETVDCSLLAVLPL